MIWQGQLVTATAVKIAKDHGTCVGHLLKRWQSGTLASIQHSRQVSQGHQGCFLRSTLRHCHSLSEKGKGVHFHSATEMPKQNMY